MVKRPAVLAADSPNVVPRQVVAPTHIVDFVELNGAREEREGLIPVGNVDNGDGKEDEGGGNDPVKLEAAE